MRTADIHNRWLEYFGKNEHEVVPSVSLISPDPSLLFTVAGMVPFIPYIIGTQQAPWPRAASVQKCIRTNDIENVGRTTRHGTFFQMNGNFSFGDYFKEGAIDLAWNLLTNSVDNGGYGFDGDKLWITLWDEDHESFNKLTADIGVDPKHIVRLPREENFWDTGQPGPAGPCAEFHVDRGAKYGPEAVGGNVDPGGDRYLEVWNLVFDQYLRGEGSGKNYPLIRELDQKAIDTGAGLERLAFLMQGKENMYEIDQVFPVIEAAQELTGHIYANPAATNSVLQAENDVKMRVIADHVRSSLMLINDGVRPGNEGRGYVLRRLMRRVIRAVRLLGYEDAVLPQLLSVSKDAMKGSYPELELNFGKISDIARGEEESFRRTLSAGTTILDLAVSKAKETKAPQLSGEEAFTLHDTYGFPIDLTLEIAAEQGVAVDQEQFRTLMREQKDRARADAVAKKQGHGDFKVYQNLHGELAQPTKFVGYNQQQMDAEIVALVSNGEAVPVVVAPAEVEIILQNTPFYPQQGGQLADHGEIRGINGGIAEVDDVQFPIAGIIVHRVRLLEGEFAVGEQVVATVDPQRRLEISRAHTATHMVHKAIQEEIGSDATQAGSENSPNRFRFDFRASQALPVSSVQSIEARVNERLQENLTVSDQITSLADAKAMGAMALFGEKYGDQVRVVTIGDNWSLELCAGTHVSQVGELGLVSLLSEASIGSGVRRIDALVGAGAYQHQVATSALVSQVSGLLNVRPEELPERITNLVSKLKDTEKELARLQQQQLSAQVPQLLDNAIEVNGIKFVSVNAGEIPAADALRTLVNQLRDPLANIPAVVAAAAVVSGKPLVIVATTAPARDAGAKAGALVRTASGVLGGGGGGKDDLAQGGGQNPAEIPAALTAIQDQLSQR